MRASFRSGCDVLRPLRRGARPGPGVERRRLVTILFCDLVDSTKLGERLDAEVMRRVQTQVFRRGGY